MYILLTILLSVILCFCVIFPLWLFATVSSQFYTFLTLLLVIAYLLYKGIRKFIRTYKKYISDEDRKKYCLRLIFKLLSILVMVVAVCFSIFFVLVENRIAGLITLLAGIAVTIVLSKYRKRFSDV